MVWDLCSMGSSNITKEFSEKRKRKIPLGTKRRTSILSVESSASCGASFPVSREKLLDRKCFVTSFRQGSYTPLRRLCVYPLWTCRPQTVLTNRSPPASLKNRILKIRPLTRAVCVQSQRSFLSPKSKKEVNHNDKTENP